MKIIPTDNEHFKTLISSEQYSLIQFSATWCGPCKQITPHIENELENWEKVQYIYLDIEDFPEVTDSYDVDGIPAFFLIKQSETIDQCAGSDMKPIVEMLEKTK